MIDNITNLKTVTNENKALNELNTKQLLEQYTNDILNAPDLDKLPAEALKEIAKKVLFEQYTETLKRDVSLKRINYQEEKQKYLDQFSSVHTRRSYTVALEKFETWLKDHDISPLDVTCANADDYIYWLRNVSGLASASIRRNVAGVSSFYSWLVRRTENKIRNPFAGTKALPTAKPVSPIEKEIPTTNLKLFLKDIKTIVKSETNPELKTLIVFMYSRGLRAGAFENMHVKGNKFFTVSKGKSIEGEIPEGVISMLKKNHVDDDVLNRWGANRVTTNFNYHIKQLFKQNKIAYRYSCHDLRHYFALNYFNKTKDIYSLSKLLGHASVNITEIYLRGLKVQLN